MGTSNLNPRVLFFLLLRATTTWPSFPRFLLDSSSGSAQPITSLRLPPCPWGHTRGHGIVLAWGYVYSSAPCALHVISPCCHPAISPFENLSYYLFIYLFILKSGLVCCSLCIKPGKGSDLTSDVAHWPNSLSFLALMYFFFLD